MIAEENLSSNQKHNISVSLNTITALVLTLLKKTVPNFKYYIASDFYKKRKLNENDFTQVFVEQAQILIRKNDYPFNINSEYKDIHNLSKGFSDFYFYPNEENVSTSSIFSVESKRLPAPEKKREKEYVIGDNKNGGIERYKIEKHGKSLNLCGMLAFVESESFDYWLNIINTWVQDLTKSNLIWKDDEILSLKENKIDYCCFSSIAHRVESKFISLEHLWIIIPD